MSLHTLQQFPDERLLDIECTSGISTIIVWCYYVLGLNVKLTFKNHEIEFGGSDFNVFIRESSVLESHATLMHPSSRHEPLFTLKSDEGDPGIGPELRKAAKGFGFKMLKQLRHDDQITVCQKWIIRQGIRTLKKGIQHTGVSIPAGPNPDAHSQVSHEKEIASESMASKTDSTPAPLEGEGKHTIPNVSDEDSSLHSAAKEVEDSASADPNINSKPQPPYEYIPANIFGLSEDSIAGAGRFLFNLEDANESAAEQETVRAWKPPENAYLELSKLIYILLCFARVQPEDLESCGDLMLCVEAHQRLQMDDTWMRLAMEQPEKCSIPELTKCFEILSFYMQGNAFSLTENARSTLVSAYGWSLFFNSVNCVDPADVFASTLRMVRGVPTRGDVRRERIVDGPNELYFSPSRSLLLQNSWGGRVNFFPGVSISNRGQPLIGYNGLDAFHIAQKFEWVYKGKTTRKHILGYREMLDICMKFLRLPPCNCNRSLPSLAEMADNFLNHKDLVETKPDSDSDEILRTFYHVDREIHTVYSDHDTPRSPIPDPKTLKECIFSAHYRPKERSETESWLFHITQKPAARWMQICDMCPRLVDAYDRESHLLLRGPETCVQCAIEGVARVAGGQPFDSAAASQGKEPINFVLL